MRRKLPSGWCVFLFFTAVYTLLFSPVIFGKRWLAPGDGHIESLPAFYSAHSLWTTNFFCGWPLCADPIIQNFNPLALCLPHLPYGWNCFVLTAYVLAGTFMYLLIRAITGSPLGALLGAVMYAMSGFLLHETDHVMIVYGAAYLPLLLLSVEKMPERREWIVIGAGAAALAIVGGNAQIFSYSLLLCGSLALFKLYSEPGRRLALLSRYLLMFTLGAGLGAVQILPSLELAGESIRQGFAFNQFASNALHPLQLIGMLFPYIFGCSNASFFKLNYFGQALPSPVLCYVGILPLILLPHCAPPRRRQPALIFWLAAALTTFLLSLGTAPLSWIIYHIPPFSAMRCHSRLFILSAAALAVCVGFAVKALRGQEISSGAIVKALASQCIALGACIFCLHQMSGLLAGQASKFGNAQLTFLPWSNPALGIQVVIFIASAAAFLAWRLKPRNWALSAVLVMILLGDLSFQGWFGNWRAEIIPQTYLQEPPFLPLYRRLLSDHQRLLPVRGASAGIDEIPPCVSRNWLVESASGYSPIMIKRYNDITHITEGGFLELPWRLSGDDRIFDLLSVKYLSVERGDSRLGKIAGLDGRAVYVKVGTFGEADLFRNERAMPRCWLAEQVKVLAPERIKQSIRTSLLPDGKEYAPDAMALIEEPANCPALSVPANVRAGASKQPGIAGTEAGAAAITNLQPEEVTVRTNSVKPGFLILSDIFYPGWSAAIDGKASHIFRTDYILRGVVVPPGRHLIRFSFQPLSFLIGASLSLSSLAILLLLGIRAACSCRFD